MGSGPSLPHLRGFENRSGGVALIVCNRVIEVVRADVWVWVDRFHYERSKWHPNARRAARYGARDTAASYDPAVRTFAVARELPCGENELYLRGGTGCVAAHLAVRLGAKRLFFVACDAWTPDRDRYHAWDGKPLDPAGLEEHQALVRNTAEGIREIARQHPDVEFLDATTGPRSLPFPMIDLDEVLETAPRR